MNDLELIKGIGPKSVEYLNKLGIFTPKDLILNYPFRYEVLKRSDLFSLSQNDSIVIDGVVASIPVVMHFRGNKNKMSFILQTKEALVNVVIFNRGFLKNNLPLNKTITIVGKWDLLKNTISASNIILKGLSDTVIIEPIYHIVSGLKLKNLKNYIDEAFKLNIPIEQYVPSLISQKYNFISKKEALTELHHPKSESTLKKALLMLKYEELFLFMLKIGVLKRQRKETYLGHSRIIDRSKINLFINNLPFELTIDQKKAVEDIINDLEAPRAMNRLLQGDVGSGKTVVAVIAIYIMFLNNYQSVLMAPTEILANQHYETIKGLFKGTNVNIRLLVGSLKKSEKQGIYDELKSGKIDLLIGTHAVIQNDVIYNKLGLVITDEQHRFGVNQRLNLKEKGVLPDILYMSATPIPRTYALTIYGDMDISNIKTMPSNRKKITTYLKTPDEIKNVLAMVKKELDNKHQIYVVAPLIEENEESNLENVNKLKRQFELAFKTSKIGMLHGKMSSKDKEEVMNKFLLNEINILISTTVIEVGIDVKNATMMIIFDAKRFGLSTLHQLRGRVGRSDLPSYCILISEEERERLKIMVEVSDGFLISEEDFKLRGHGDLFGQRQSGDMAFKIADLKKDYKILLEAKEDVKIFLDNNLIDAYPSIKREINISNNLV